MANSRKNIEAKCSIQNKISTENKIKLLDHFSQNPGKKDIEKISKKTGLDDKRIKAWFRRQRYYQRQINNLKKIKIINVLFNKNAFI